ncbi:unnamed protein product [Camellia sinensis]
MLSRNQNLEKMELAQSDIERGSLSIPFEKARLHFLPMNRVSIHQIVITDTLNDNWFMTLTYNAPKEGYVVPTSENSHTKQVRDEEVRHDAISESKFG